MQDDLPDHKPWARWNHELEASEHRNRRYFKRKTLQGLTGPGRVSRPSSISPRLSMDSKQGGLPLAVRPVLSSGRRDWTVWNIGYKIVFFMLDNKLMAPILITPSLRIPNNPLINSYGGTSDRLCLWMWVGKESQVLKLISLLVRIWLMKLWVPRRLANGWNSSSLLG